GSLSIAPSPTSRLRRALWPNVVRYLKARPVDSVSRLDGPLYDRSAVTLRLAVSCLNVTKAQSRDLLRPTASGAPLLIGLDNAEGRLPPALRRGPGSSLAITRRSGTIRPCVGSLSRSFVRGHK